MDKTWGHGLVTIFHIPGWSVIFLIHYKNIYGHMFAINNSIGDVLWQKNELVRD